jgi:hypothetical protein
LARSRFSAAFLAARGFSGRLRGARWWGVARATQRVDRRGESVAAGAVRGDARHDRDRVIGQLEARLPVVRPPE